MSADHILTCVEQQTTLAEMINVKPSIISILSKISHVNTADVQHPQLRTTPIFFIFKKMFICTSNFMIKSVLRNILEL